MKEVLAVNIFPVDFCDKFVILNRDFCIKKCDGLATGIIVGTPPLPYLKDLGGRGR